MSLQKSLIAKPHLNRDWVSFGSPKISIAAICRHQPISVASFDHRHLQQINALFGGSSAYGNRVLAGAKLGTPRNTII